MATPPPLPPSKPLVPPRDRPQSSSVLRSATRSKRSLTVGFLVALALCAMFGVWNWLSERSANEALRAENQRLEKELAKFTPNLVSKSFGERPAEATHSAITRDEFREKAIGKTPQELLKAFGQPDRTNDYGGGDVVWYYQARTLDPVTNNVDGQVIVNFERGRVKRVSF